MLFRFRTLKRTVMPSESLIAIGILGLTIFAFSNSLQAQTIETVEIPSSPNPVGSGARALGMGGAFIAVADDATAASWNPGGLVQLEHPELSVVGAGFLLTEDISFGATQSNTNTQSVSEANLNYLSFAYPFTLFQHNMIVSINYQRLFDFSRNWKFTVFDDSYTFHREFKQTGSLYAYGLAYCVEILPRFSFGFTLNLWENGLYDNGWNKKYSETLSYRDIEGNSSVIAEQSRSDRYSFRGFNANVGILWSITDKLSLGAVFKSPFTADLKHDIEDETKLITSPANELSASFDQKLDMPMSYGLGLAYRFSDKFTVSADVYRTEWQDFVITDAAGNKISPISGLPTDESHIDPTTQVRIGAEYLFIKPKYVIPLRIGAFYDPAPAENDPDDFFGVTIGSGIGFRRFIFDFAYQYRFGRDVGKSILRELDFSEDLDEHSFYSSLIIHF